MQIVRRIVKEVYSGKDVCVVGPEGPWKYEVARYIERFFKGRVKVLLL